MAQVTIVIADTPNGGVSVYTDFQPAIGAPCSTAQAAALDIIARTRKSYGLDSKPQADARAFAQTSEQARQAIYDSAESQS